MTGFEQLLAHLWGDYIFQSDWMAQNKTKDSIAAFAHALAYSSMFVLLRPSLAAWSVIFVSHFLIDRFRLARYVVWAKNWIGPKWIPYDCDRSAPPVITEYVRNESWWRCQQTGYPPNTPVWLSTWLLIIADNILHITINYFALRYL